MRSAGRLGSRPSASSASAMAWISLVFLIVDKREARARLGLDPGVKVMVGVGNLIPLKDSSG